MFLLQMDFNADYIIIKESPEIVMLYKYVIY